MKTHPLKDAYQNYLRIYDNSMEMRKMARQTFSAQLSATRRTLGMTVRELGSHIGVTGSLINQIERSASSVLKSQQIEKILELCESSLKSKKTPTRLESVDMEPTAPVPPIDEAESSLCQSSTSQAQSEQ